ncbi:unnamed protein product [Effrenium voratum]|uniref:Uncharacterized protein n=1 Tax=Effrenium voratum TaxID=2562239 RepID=A0AA36HN61_9DINO|nr:unnamed protein product [Effrenium voratum]
MARGAAKALVTGLALWLVADVLCFVNLPGTARGGATPRRAGFEQGKLNLGVEGSVVKSKHLPTPVLEASESTNKAIQECLEEGCSVEALMELDQKLAKDEATVKATLDKLHSSQAEEYSEEGNEQIAWLANFLDRSGSLRAQLQAVSTLKAEGDLVAQIMRAAAVAFGGGRKGDYPSAGVSSYSS